MIIQFTNAYMGITGSPLTHWGRVRHICVSELTIIGSDNGLLPGQRQAIIWTNAGILLKPLGTNFNEILIEIHMISFTKIHLKMSSGKWLPFCLGLNVLIKPFGVETGILWENYVNTMAADGLAPWNQVISSNGIHYHYIWYKSPCLFWWWLSNICIISA